MKKMNKFILPLMIIGLTCMTSCREGETSTEDTNKNPNINNNVIDECHTLHFFDSDKAEFILSLVVNESETYEDLLPFFPTLTKEEGKIKYWDGDYTYDTQYNHDNQFKVWDANDLEIEVYSHIRMDLN